MMMFMIPYDSYVCACPFNPYSTGTGPYSTGTGSPYNILDGTEPTAGECTPGSTKGWHKGNCGITNIYDTNYDADKLITNLQATGHPDDGFPAGSCPNFDQCADYILHRINSIAIPDSTAVSG